MVRLLLALALLCIAAHGTAQTKGDPAAGTAQTERFAAGKVELTEGDVRFLDARGNVRRPRVGDAIYESESIATGAGGEVHLRMEDSGYVAVRPGTSMRIVNFRAQGDPDDRSIIALLQGSFRSVTGWIAKGGRDRAVINTPTATIGIRGTEHEPLVIPQGSAVGEPGTYDRVHAGQTEIRTKQGTIAVRPNQAGFAALSGAARPRVLDRIPTFFRPTRNEARFTGLHERVSRQLVQHREERRRFFEERRRLKGERPVEGKGRGAKGAEKGELPGAGKGRNVRGTEQGERRELERREQKQREELEKKQRSAADRRRVQEDQQRKADEHRRELQEQQRKANKQLERRDEKKHVPPEARRAPAEHGKADKKDHAKGGK